MVYPLLMAGLSAGASLLSGIGNQRAAKKQAKTQAAKEYIANELNKRNIMRTNEAKRKLALKLGKELKNTKEVTTQDHAGGSRQDNYSYVDTAGMMAAAEASGFNPVTFINAGGLQAYTQTGSLSADWSQDTETRTGHNAVAVANLKAQLMTPETFLMDAGVAQNIPDIYSVLGDAAGAGIKAYSDQANVNDAQSLQRELLNTKLAAIQKNAQSNRSSGSLTSVPSISTSGGTRTSGSASGGGAGASGGLSKGGTWENPKPLPQDDDVKYTNPHISYGGRVNPFLADAGGAWTQRYGEGVEILAGFGIAAADAKENMSPFYRRYLGLDDKRSGWDRLFGEANDAAKWMFGPGFGPSYKWPINLK